MQKRVAASRVGLPHGRQRGLDIREIAVVLGVFGHPLRRQLFNGFHRCALLAFGVDRAEKPPHIGL